MTVTNNNEQTHKHKQLNIKQHNPKQHNTRTDNKTNTNTYTQIKQEIKHTETFKHNVHTKRRYTNITQQLTNTTYIT